jgi:hypothetical protein
MPLHQAATRQWAIRLEAKTGWGEVETVELVTITRLCRHTTILWTLPSQMLL